MSEANKKVIHRWFQEVWNEGREDTIDELSTPTTMGIGLGEGDIPTRGPAEFKVFVKNMRGAIPDIKMHIEDSISEGDKVVVRVTVEGTHRGEGLGIAPSGNRVKFAGLILLRVVDGKITEAWNSWDQLGLLRQIGALEKTESQDRFLTARS